MDFGFLIYTCGQTRICVRLAFPFHPPTFKDGKTGPDTQANMYTFPTPTPDFSLCIIKPHLYCQQVLLDNNQAFCF
jgi:hypothetical protein